MDTLFSTMLVLFLTIMVCAPGYSKHYKRGNDNLVNNDGTFDEIIRVLRDLTDQENVTTEENQHGTGNPKKSDKERDAENWLNVNDKELATRSNAVAIASWNYETNLTDENAKLISDAEFEMNKWMGDRAKEAKNILENETNFQNKTAERMLYTWVNGNTIADNPNTEKEISRLSSEMMGIYGTAQVVKDGKTYHMDPELKELMATSRDYDELLWSWIAWRNITGPAIKPKFTQTVAYKNEGARDNGYEDLGVSWRLGEYEIDNLDEMVDKLLTDIEPLYKQLHAYVRHKLSQFYGSDKVDPTKPIPAHLLGNMWAQEWNNIYDIVIPFPNITQPKNLLKEKGYTPINMFEAAEEFFTSIGLEPMTEIFWNKSLIIRPPDRDVQCNGSAEDFMTDDDFRIKMCTEVNMEDFGTIHKGMGRIEYFMQYRHQPAIYRTAACPAFHEAVGDTIALSVVTTEHLETIGLLDVEDDKKRLKKEDGELSDEEKQEINMLMVTALEKIAPLPFGYLIEKWRWGVFSGDIDERNYNAKWWEYREKYQGIAPPVERSENDFDPGAKYHVPGFVPYIRYFLSFIGQFQFHKALCQEQGHEGLLHLCDIYHSTEAGDLLKSFLSLGKSEPWPDAMEKFTGHRDFSTDAIYEYFFKLYMWLQKQSEENEDIKVGWD